MAFCIQLVATYAIFSAERTAKTRQFHICLYHKLIIRFAQLLTSQVDRIITLRQRFVTILFCEGCQSDKQRNK